MSARNLFDKQQGYRENFWGLFILFVILASSLCHYNCASGGELEIRVYPPEYFISGTESALRVIVLESKTGQPVPEAQVTVRLKKEKTDRPELLFEGKTNSYGTPSITLNIPEDLEGACQLIVEVQSTSAKGKVSVPVTAKKTFKIFLTSEKAVYRPGQTIHMRGLVFENSKAAKGQEVSIEVVEPSGYSVLNKTVKTCDYGIAEADFTLGNEIKTGDYTIRFFPGAFHDTAPSPGDERNPTQTVCAAYRSPSPRGKEEKKVRVTDAPPPTFTLECQTEKNWYIPGEEIKGQIKAAYLLGKPLDQGRVSVVLYKKQEEKSEKIADIQGITDSTGTYAFSYPLPVEQDVPLEKQSSNRLYRLLFEAVVQDGDRVETITYSLPVSRYPIVIQPVPESGVPKTGLENTIYVVTTYPDGTPASCTINLENRPDGNLENTQTYPGIHTDLQGLGEFKLFITPGHYDDQLFLAARDSRGNTGERLWRFPLDKKNKENVILRTDRSVYKGGETPGLTIVSTQQQGNVYLDVLNENQIILTRESTLEGGKASIKLPMAGKHTGTLTCHARIVPGQKKGSDSFVLEDQRKIIVLPAEEEAIELTFQPSKDKYLSGEEASMEIVTRRNGQGCAAALGITIVEGAASEASPAEGDIGADKQQINRVELASTSPLLYHAGEPARPRSILQHFSPVILYTNPRLITDADGRASFTVRLGEGGAAPVTEWRVAALAHTRDGKMASGIYNLPVDQESLVEMDLPPQLTQEDEITIPVTISNYHPAPQEVLLQLRKDDWFELSGSASRKTMVNPHDKKVEYFKIRAIGSGNHQMRLDSRFPDSGRNDALSRPVTVKSLGRKIEQVFNFNLSGEGEMSKPLPIPGTAIRGSEKLKLKILPVFINQVSDGFQGMLRMPRGCFEQTSSFTYPNIMVLDYMQQTGQGTPEIKEKAKKYISDGYQKLLQYEAKEGGFSFFRPAGYAQEVSVSWTGNAQKILTAYGLMLFSDMEKVYPIDGAIIPRVQNWLISQMKGDHWQPDSHFGAASSARNNDFAATAYITWALLHSGLDKNNKGLQKAIAYLENNYKSYADNANALSYFALAMIKAKKDGSIVIRTLNQLANKDEDAIYWTPESHNTGTKSFPAIANVETTAIAALANLEANNNSLDINKILHYLLQHKSAFGNWGSSQATVLTLKVLIAALPQRSRPIFGNVRTWMDNNLIKEITFNEENNKIKQVVDFKNFIGVGNPELRIKYQVIGQLFCQVLLSYYVKWDEPLVSREQDQAQSPINLTLIYDTRRLNKGETVTVDATASYLGKEIIPFAIVEIGVPPGFTSNPGDFRRLKEKRLIDRFEIDNGRIILYLSNLSQKGFRFGLKALSQGRVKMPEARIYDYYNPQVMHVAPPVELTVI